MNEVEKEKRGRYKNEIEEELVMWKHVRRQVRGWQEIPKPLLSESKYVSNIEYYRTSILIVRTVFSPKCWATSSTRRGMPAATVTSRAFRMGGSGPSNWIGKRRLRLYNQRRKDWVERTRERKNWRSPERIVKVRICKTGHTERKQNISRHQD